MSTDRLGKAAFGSAAVELPERLPADLVDAILQARRNAE
jgi:hypothetical protein